ncbi:MAG TPA: hypothetical protein VH595_17335 [Verrucomicrobiae bacterium]|nr:hypothetical protein [Verrucomicrobiae bacterium]
MSFVIGSLAQPSINYLYPPTLSERAGDHEAFIISATASSGALSYAWHKTDNPFVFSTSNFLALSNIQPSNAGSYYAVVTDAAGSVQSANVTLDVLPNGPLQLYSTNLILARVGDGAQPLSGATGNTLYLDQYTTNGTYIDTIQVPDEGLGERYGTGSVNSAALPAGSSSLLIAGGNVSPGNDAPYEAFLARAPNGLSISFGGYCQAYPFQGSDVSAEPGGNGGNDWRGIATVDSFGYYSLVWTNTGLYSGGNHQFHGAVDIDGNATNYYTVGEAGTGNAIKYCNINFQPANGSGIAAVAGSLGGTRVAQVAGGSLVFSDVGAGTIGLYACSGLPNNTATASLIIPEPSKPLDFAFSPDLTTVYITDNGTYRGSSVEAGGLQRWDASGGGADGFPGYHYSYTLQMGTGSTVGGRAVTVDFSAATSWGAGVHGAKIYVTTAESSGNRLLRIVDNGAGSPSTTLVSVPTNLMLSGVRFGPVFVPPNFSIQPQPQTGLFGFTVTFSAFAAGTGPLAYQWYFQSNGVGTFTAISGETNDTYEINEAETNNLGNYYVVVTDPLSASAQSQTVSFSLPGTSGISLAVNTLSPGLAIPWDFLGLSFEEANLKSNGVGVVGYMFDSSDTQLITLFTNLGIKNLRIGGTSVDTNNEVIPLYVPTNQDIDALFRFAPAAGVEVSLSFRLENGNSQLDAALAGYTWSNYNRYLTCFEIGNEPDEYGNGDPQITGFSSYLAKWTAFEQAILDAAPNAKFGGPDSAGTAYAGEFANAEIGSPNITSIFSHFYAGGGSSGLTAAQIIAGMLSPNWDNNTYPSHLSQTEAIANADGFPFRSTEFNSYVANYPGLAGGNNVFAAALYACDAAHWWAANNCNGVNFHTFLGKYNATIYYDINGNYQIYPIGYGIKAFELGSHGAVIPVTMTNTNSLNVTAYGVGSSNDLFVTIVNKEYAPNPYNAAVTITPEGIPAGSVRAMFLMATNGVTATNNVTLGGAFITNNAAFDGQWTNLGYLTNGQCVVTVPISSAAIVEIRPPPSVTFTLQTPGAGQYQLNWNAGVLQSAPTLGGPYTDLPGAASPWLITPTNGQQYYRVRASY